MFLLEEESARAMLSGVLPRVLDPKFRAPDHLGAPSGELAKLTGGAYQKVSGSRRLGPHLDLGNARSASFQNLLAGVRRLQQELLALPDSH